MMVSKRQFDGERVKFCVAFEEVSRGVAKYKQAEYLDQGAHPIVDQGQRAIAGYSNDEEGLFGDVPAIVFGDHTRAVKYVDQPFFVGADGVKILKPLLSKNVRYWYHALRAARIEGLGYSRHFKLLKEQSFRNAPEREQRQIVDALDKILAQIESCEKEVEKLDALVKSRFVEMFGDPIENPLGWETRSLTSLGECKNGLNYRSEDSGYEYPCLGVSDFKDLSTISDTANLNTVTLGAEPAESYLLKDGDIVFVRSNGNKELVGRCVSVYPGDEKVVFSGFCIRLRVMCDEIRVPYLVWALKHPSMRRMMFGRGANVQNLSQKLMSNVPVPIPSIEEQDEFLDFVAKVDKPRFVAQQQIEKSQMLYDSLAQEYFG